MGDAWESEVRGLDVEGGSVAILEHREWRQLCLKKRDRCLLRSSRYDVSASIGGTLEMLICCIRAQKGIDAYHEESETCCDKISSFYF